MLPYLFAFAASLSVVHADDWTLVKMTDAATKYGAVCLDGSPGAYYIRKPQNASLSNTSNMWMLFHEGGGWCTSDESCYERSTRDLGSSKAYGPDLIGSEGGPLFDLPTFATFTIVYAKYCDGSSWSGDNSTVTYVDGNASKPVYYRGRRLLDALFEDLRTTQGLSTVDEFIYAGCSAGALTAYLHLDYIRTLLPPTSKVAGYADAMFTVNTTTYDGLENFNTQLFSWGYTAWNSSHSVNRACLAHYGHDEAWVCMLGATAAQFLVTPMLVVNSKYGSYQSRFTLGNTCLGVNLPNGTVDLCANNISNNITTAAAQVAFELQYGDATVAAATALPKQHGALLTNCVVHCQSGDLKHTLSDPGVSLQDGIDEWYSQVMTAGQEPGWAAPRLIASNSDLCLKKPPPR